MDQDADRAPADSIDDRDQDPAPTEPGPSAPGAAAGDRSTAVTPAGADRLSYAEMLEQLSAMARQVAEDAPPALRDASAVAAIFGATAARNAGPLAHSLADATDTYGNRLADQLEAYAERTREEETEDAGRDDEGEPPES